MGEVGLALPSGPAEAVSVSLGWEVGSVSPKSMVLTLWTQILAWLRVTPLPEMRAEMGMELCLAVPPRCLHPWHHMGSELDHSHRARLGAASTLLSTLILNPNVLTVALQIFLQKAFPERTHQVLFRTSWGISILFLELKRQMSQSPAWFPGSVPNST